MHGKHAKYILIEEDAQDTEELAPVEVPDAVEGIDADADNPTAPLDELPTDDAGADGALDDVSSNPTERIEKLEEVDNESDDDGSEAPSEEPEAPAQPCETEASESESESESYEPTFDIPAKRSKTFKRASIAAGSVLGALLAAYLGGALAFSHWMMPGTMLAGEDVSLKSSEEITQMIGGIEKDYSLSIAGGEFSFKEDAAKLGMAIDADKSLDNIRAALNPWQWPVLLAQGNHDATECLAVNFDVASLQNELNTALDAHNKAGKPSTDAHVGYSQESHAFVVVPETYGTQYEPERVYDDARDAINGLQTKVELAQDDLIQPRVFSDDEKLATAAFEATKLIQADIKLNMDGTDVATIGPDMLHQLVSFDENMVPKLDEETLVKYVDDLVDGMDTIGSERTFTREDGKEITVSGGAYGWEISDPEEVHDQVLELLKERKSGTVEIECDSTADVFQGPGKRDWGSRYIDIDLTEQYVRFYDDGDIIWESYCISGTPDGENDTNTGVWYITRKESPSKLIGWKNGKKIYESTVRYWMPFEGNVIGLHDADWQPDFGGNMYREGYGSHGCVNLPVYKAEELYYIVDVNDVVVVHW